MCVRFCMFVSVCVVHLCALCMFVSVCGCNTLILELYLFTERADLVCALYVFVSCGVLVCGCNVIIRHILSSLNAQTHMYVCVFCACL